MIVIAALVGILTGCCYCQKYQRLYGRPLEGTRWTLVQLNGTPVEAPYVLVMSGSDMTIDAAGSLVTARYKADKNGNMSISEIALRSAPTGDEAMEKKLVTQMRTTTSYKMDGKFVMMIRNGEMWAMYEAKEPRDAKYKPGRN
ncbi:MAG: META domain-containing protein [Rikenellaceae bacterium]|nr:META domain-containing protein [Rikenellaceae bacterium]